MDINKIFATLVTWINSLQPNEISFLGNLIGVIATLITAFIAVKTAFKQIARQFEHKIIYEGWKDLQQNLFTFSNALLDYDSKIHWLNYFVTSEHNILVNEGNNTKHRQKKWHDITDSYSNLQKAYIALLRSYENHEVIFLSLNKMKIAFIYEYRSRIENPYDSFMEKIFPEMYGKTEKLNPHEAKKKINKYWFKMSELSAFLDDFRIELQNATVGQILKKKVPRRSPPDTKYKILTQNGLKHSSSSIIIQNFFRNLFKYKKK